jgi:hypothetical protein
MWPGFHDSLELFITTNPFLRAHLFKDFSAIGASTGVFLQGLLVIHFLNVEFNTTDFLLAVVL